MKPPRPILALAVLPLLGSGGCCSLARLFCGPDKSPWVSVSYQSPRATLATLLEAIRRDDSAVIYFCLSRSYKQAHELDGIGATAAWNQIRREVPYIHLLGYVPVPADPEVQQDGSASYHLDLDGRSLRVDLVRQAFWTVRYQRTDGTTHETSKYLGGDALDGYASIESAGTGEDDLPQSRLALAPLVFLHPGVEPLTLDQVEHVELGLEWKVGNLSLPQ